MENNKTLLRELNAHLASSDSRFAAKVLTKEGFLKWAEGKDDLTFGDFKPEALKEQ